MPRLLLRQQEGTERAALYSQLLWQMQEIRIDLLIDLRLSSNLTNGQMEIL